MKHGGMQGLHATNGRMENGNRYSLVGFRVVDLPVSGRVGTGKISRQVSHMTSR